MVSWPWEAALGHICKYLREAGCGGEIDAAILPYLSAPKGTMPIVSAGDFPEHIVTWKDYYAEIDPKAYYPVYK